MAGERELVLERGVCEGGGGGRGGFVPGVYE